LHLNKHRYENTEAQVDTSCINSNLDLEHLGRSELTVKCTNAFNRILPMFRSTFFSLQLQFLCLLYCTFQCCNVIIWTKQNIWLTLATNELCNFTNLPITSCILGHNFLTTLELNTFYLCPSLNTRDENCNINKQQVKIHITFPLSHKLYIHIKYHKDTTQRNRMQQLWNSTVIQWIQTNAELWQKCSNT
jgi:hypothetical protein